MQTYYRPRISIPLLDQLLMGIYKNVMTLKTSCFGYNLKVYLVPAVMEEVTREQVIDKVQAFSNKERDDLPSPHNLHDKLHYTTRC